MESSRLIVNIKPKLPFIYNIDQWQGRYARLSSKLANENSARARIIEILLFHWPILNLAWRHFCVKLSR